MKRYLLWIFLATFYTSGDTAAAMSISATAWGDTTPARTTFPGTVTNGDFTIEANNATAPMVGDGIDEQTSWAFDLTGSEAFTPFLSYNHLTSAVLTLTLTPWSPFVSTDIVTLVGVGDVALSDGELIANLPVGITSTTSFDFANFLDPEEIFKVFSANNGVVNMRYADDAIVSFAYLELINELPLPATAWLFGSGLLGLLFRNAGGIGLG